MDKQFHNVGDLPSSERSAVETIIGHSLRDDQQLYIVALDAAVEPTERVRLQAWNEIEEIIAETHQNVRQSGVSQEDLERTIDETCDEVRYGK
jgi:hypothetical protein